MSSLPKRRWHGGFQRSDFGRPACELGDHPRGTLRPDGCPVVCGVLGDLVAVVLALMAAFWMRFYSGWITFRRGSSGAAIPPAVRGLFAVGAAFLLGLLDVYRRIQTRHILGLRRTALLVARSIMTWFVLYLGVSLALKLDPPISRIYAASSALASAIALVGWRALFYTGGSGGLARPAIAKSRPVCRLEHG